MTEDEARKAGREAYLQGKSNDHNPFRDDAVQRHREWSAWREGWAEELYKRMDKGRD